MQVRHVTKISSRNIPEKPNLALLNNGTAKWTACMLQRYSIPELPRFDFFFHVLTFPVPGLNFVHFFRCFLFMQQFLLRQNFAPTRVMGPGCRGKALGGGEDVVVLDTQLRATTTQWLEDLRGAGLEFHDRVGRPLGPTRLR